MIANPFFLISILISALISFVVAAGIVESTLLLFKIRQGRARALLRIFPFLSLLFDLLPNTFSIGNWLNPLNCSSCVQKFLATIFWPELRENLENLNVSLLSYLGLKISHPIFSIGFVLFSMATLYFISRALFEWVVLARALKDKMKPEYVCRRLIKNNALSASLQKNKVVIFSHENIAIPMAAYSKAVLMPRKVVEDFSQEEFEAIVAHELEHVIWRDHAPRLFSQLVSQIFWWVPTRLLRKKLAFDQELACDQSLFKYGFSQEFLASALIKVARSAKENSCPIFCYFIQEKHPALQRIHLMFDPAFLDSDEKRWASYAATAIGLFTGWLCAFWA